MAQGLSLGCLSCADPEWRRGGASSLDMPSMQLQCSDSKNQVLVAFIGKVKLRVEGE